MANKTTIITKYGTTTPSAGVLAVGELAVDHTNKKIFTKNAAGAVITLAGLDTLPEILANGNTTGANDIAVDTDQKIQFRDTAIYINSSADGQLDIVADTEIQIAATTVDLNGNLDVSGTLGVTGVLTGTSLDISGDIDVDGTTNLDVVDIDGAVDFASTTAHAGNATFADNAKAIFGAGSDLQIYHHPTDGSFIVDNGTGNLQLDATDFRVRNTAGTEAMIHANADGAVKLFYDGGATPKLATTATGINVTGSVTADGLTVQGSSDSTILVEATGGNDASLFLTEAGTGIVGAQLVYDGGDNTLYVRVDNNGSRNRLSVSRDTGDISFYDTAAVQSAKFYWDASAESLGIGTSSPTGTLHVAGSASTVPIKIDNTGTGGNTWRIWSTNDAASDGGGKLGFYNEDTATRAMTLDSSGKVGVGTGSPTGAYAQPSLHIHATGSGAEIHLTDGDTGATATDGMSIFQYGVDSYIHAREATGTLRTFVGGTERMRIDASGNLLVGKTVSGTGAIGFEVQQDGEVYSIIASGNNTYHAYSGGAYKFYVGSNGGISNFSANNVNLSDEREKKNIEALPSQWDCLKHWDLKQFHYNADDDALPKKYGVIAQEIEAHCPEVIDVFNVDEDTERKGVKEQQMMWMAIKALQEAQTRIESLEARIAALES